MFIRVRIRKTRNTGDFLGSGTKLLLPSLSLGFWHEERETQFFYADCSSIVSFQFTDSTNTRAHPAVHNLTGHAQVRKINSLRLSPNLNSLLFSKSLRIPALASVNDAIHIPSGISYLGFSLWHLWLSHPPRARVNTWTQCVQLTNPCTKPKGSKPN